MATEGREKEERRRQRGEERYRRDEGEGREVRERDELLSSHFVFLGFLLVLPTIALISVSGSASM